MNCLKAFQQNHPALFLIADRFLVYFVLFPFVVGFWAGAWFALDATVLPNQPELSGWVFSVVGSAILVFFNLVQYELTKRFLEPADNVGNIVVKRLYSLIAGCANVVMCQGMWKLIDHYFEITVPSAWYSFVCGTVGLVALRASCNGMGTPLGTAFDEHPSFFIIQTRFGATTPVLLFLDSVFSVTVIGTLAVLEWRGLWTVLDLQLYPENAPASIAVCLCVGFTMCFAIDALQYRAIAVSTWLENSKHWILRLVFEDIFLFIAKIGVVFIWHGYWVLTEKFVNIYGHWIPVVVGFIVPALLLHANTIFVLEVVLDGGLSDGAGCRVKVTMLEHYLTLCDQRREAKRGYAKGRDGEKASEAFLEGSDKDITPAFPRGKTKKYIDQRDFYLSEVLPP